MKHVFFFFEDSKANLLDGGVERLTLNIEHDGGFAGSHGISATADVFT